MKSRDYEPQRGIRAHNLHAHYLFTVNPFPEGLLCQASPRALLLFLMMADMVGVRVPVSQMGQLRLSKEN